MQEKPPHTHTHSWASPLLFLISPLLSSSSSLSLSVCLFLMSLHQTSWKIHSSAFNRSCQPNPSSPTDTVLHSQIWAHLEMQEMEEDRTKVLEDYEEIVCLCVCWRMRADWVFSVPLGSVSCDRLSGLVMCDRWRTVSVSCLGDRSFHRHRHEPTSPDVQQVNCEILMLPSGHAYFVFSYVVWQYSLR